MNDRIIISAQNISIGYPKLRNRKGQCLYNNLSFNVMEGELTCLIGSNGAGKSTLLRTISSIQPLLGGEIQVLNKNITKYKARELSQLIGLVLTDKTASGGFTVREIVELGRYPHTGFFGILNNRDVDIVNHSIKSVGIEHKADSFVADLSDGERQKVMIAKSLSQECPIIILDEPTAFLDVESRIEIMNLLHHLAHNNGKTILLSTHDIDLAFLLADKLWMLSEQSQLITGVTEDIILSGSINHFFTNDKIAFNKYSGSFYPIRSSNLKVFVDAKDEFLFWTINLLLRLGLDYTTNPKEAIYSIKIDQPKHIEVKNKDSIVVCNNFEELARYIKQQN